LGGPGDRVVTFNLTNTGAVTAYHAAITSITGITVLKGSGMVRILSGIPAL
jgi:hypothetical protein